MAVFYCWIICLSAAFSLGIAVSAVDICSNATQSGKLVILKKAYRSGSSCGCSIELADGNEKSNVTFRSVGYPKGCQYKLNFSLKNESRVYTCQNRSVTYQFSIPTTDPPFVYLMDDRNDTSDFEFNFTIHAETIVKLICHSPWTALLSTVRENDIPPETTDITQKSENSSLTVILGCSVSGVVLILLVIAAVIFFLKRRKERRLYAKRLSEQNISGGPTYSGCYEDVSNLTTQNENKDTGYAVTFSQSIDNDLNNFDDYDHLPEPNHVPAQPNHVLAQPNHVPTQPKHVPAQPNHVPIQLKDVPNTSDEYAVVDKKSKKGSSKSNVIELNNKSKKVKVNEDYENIPKDKLNLKREIDRIVGPKGDEYTLVNKC